MGAWKRYTGGQWVPQAGVVGSGGGGGGPFQVNYEIFGPESRSAEALTATNTGGYIFPGSALSASTVLFPFDAQYRRAISATWTLVWTPNDAANGVRLVHMDSGPTNVTAMSEQTANSATTPLHMATDVTAAFNALVDSGVRKYLGHQINAGGTGPLVYVSRLVVVWE